MGRYRLGRRLGAGGFGAVHEAVDERLNRWVAVKVLHAEGAAPERVRREAVAAARLDHPGIVAVFDAGEEDGSRYLVSELVEGRTLAQLEAAEELSDRDVLRIGLALTDALEHAHERGVVHRDVKPQNVLVPYRHKSWRGAAKLADFGVAMLAGDDPLTMTGDVVGTLAYMAPEQAAGRRVDARADLYAVALVLYEALAGVNPMRGANPADTARRVGGPVPSLQRHRRDLPPELCAALDRALRTAPAERGTLADLGDALEDALTDVDDDGGTIARHPLERGWAGQVLPEVPRGAPRIAHAAGTGVVVAASLAAFGSGLEFSVPAAAAVAVLLVALLPRVGWVVAIGGAIVALAAGSALTGGADAVAAAGSAAVLAVAAVPVPFALARLPRAWSAPVAAPLLGLAGAAGAFPALAARAPSWLERAALGALGAWWLLLAEVLAGRTAYLGVPDGAPSGDSVQGALSIAGDAIGDVVASGLPLLLVLWALAAAVAPWVIRGRSLAFDVVTASAWAAGLASATGALATWLGAGEPRGLVAGAVLAGVAAVAGARMGHFARADGD